MKNLFLPLLFFSSVALSVPVLQWDPSAGAEGYNVYCGPTPVGAVTPVDVGNVTTYDLAGSVTEGVQYECWVTAHAVGLPESADSNHIQFTPPSLVQTFTVPGQPSSVTIQWQ